MRTLLGIVLAGLFLAACASNQATGSLRGRPFAAQLSRAVYCQHCPGVSVEVEFRPRAQPRGWTLVVVSRDPDCTGRAKSRLGVSDGWSAISLCQDAGGQELRAVAGELDISECSPERFAARFWARFQDGSRISGSVSTPLELDAGYD